MCVNFNISVEKLIMFLTLPRTSKNDVGKGCSIS